MKRVTAVGLALMPMAGAAACGGSRKYNVRRRADWDAAHGYVQRVVQVGGVDSHNFTIITGGNSLNVTREAERAALKGPPSATIVITNVRWWP